MNTRVIVEMQVNPDWATLAMPRTESRKIATNVKIYVPDPFPTLSLTDIYPISTRAKSWLARASTLDGFSDAYSVQIAGGVFMLSGLDYHHSQFMAHVAQLAPYYQRMNAVLKRAADQLQAGTASPLIATNGEKSYLDALDHEAVAYINRVGQFWFFAKSMKLEALLPRAGKLVIFRHKHTAHRSLDMHRDEPPEVREFHAMAFNFSRSTTKDFFPVFHIDGKEQHVTFHMSDDHPAIMDEAMQLLQRIYAAE